MELITGGAGGSGGAGGAGAPGSITMNAGSGTLTTYNGILGSLVFQQNSIIMVNPIPNPPPATMIKILDSKVTTLAEANNITEIYFDTATKRFYHTGGNSATISIAQLEKITEEEEKLLANLSKDRATATKKMKLDKFKSLPSEYRQGIVDRITWADKVRDMNNTSAPISQEEADLLAKKQMSIDPWNSGFSGLYPGNVTISDLSYPWAYPQATIPLPEGISTEDLIRAHLEATMEETVIGNRSE